MWAPFALAQGVRGGRRGQEEALSLNPGAQSREVAGSVGQWLGAAG